jgi:pSer/pThr/pTyr-binding forkhead associated (FHA) protein
MPQPMLKIGAIHVRLVGDPQVRSRHVRVIDESAMVQHPGEREALSVGAGHAEQQTATLTLPRGSESSERAALLELDAFLIVEGGRHVPLDKPVVTLGRRSDNDVIIDATAVSRQHAQIRWRFGRFVLYDTSSRGRTMVNGVRVKEQVLQSGDVIALSDVLIVFAEGSDPATGDRRGRHDTTGGEATSSLRPEETVEFPGKGR